MSAYDIASPPLAASRLARARSSRWAALPVVLAGTFMVVLDFFIVNVAMPAMQADLHASTGAIEWVVAGYGLTFATLLITAGRLGDQGRPAARRGPPARLAALDVAVARRRAGPPRGVCRPPARALPPRRRAAARPEPVPRARVHRRPRDPACLLVRPGVVLPRPRAVPPARARP